MSCGLFASGERYRPALVVREEPARLTLVAAVSRTQRAPEVGDRSIKLVAKDRTETALREWAKRADVDAGEGPPEASDCTA
jgi:hypothetical protein